MTNKTLILLLFSLKIYGQNNFDIKEIRNIDLSGINSVIRFSDTQITIESNKSFTVKKHWAVTVFNEASEADYASLKVYYDKFSTVKKIEGTIYDGEGKELKKLRNADVKDFATSSYGDDVTDNRVKYAEFNKKFYPYPYTVEFEYEERSSNMLFIPTWFPVEADQTFLQNAKLHLIYPSDFALRLKEVNMLQKSEKLNINNKNEEVWNLKNYKTPVSEPYSREMMYPYIIFSASNFVVEDYSGSGKSWQDLSLFYHNLNKDRGKVPANLESEIQKMLAGINSKEEKVKKIYEYIQTHTRYQSIQLGIGGWQTRVAMEVAEKGYGDCKALTNFAISLLKLANITAYPVLIRAGDDQLLQDTDISRMTFNHVIACVPIEKDTIWLECTSQDNPFGYQGDFTGNRKGLLIKPENGGLINTIQYRPDQNLIQRSANISVSESGDANIKVNTKYTGIQHENRANVYKTKSPQEQIDWLTARYTIPNIQIVAHTNKLNKLKIPELIEDIEIYSGKLGTITGKRLFLKPNLFANNIAPPTLDSTRVTELFLNPNSLNFVDIDSLSFELPSSYSIEAMPKDLALNYKFGTFNTSYKMVANKLIYSRKWRLIGGNYPKNEFNNWVDFLKKIGSSDKQKVVLVKKT